MNFLFFSGGSYVGGMEIVIQSLMAQLNAMGHRTLAIISGWNDGDYPTRLKASGLAFEEVKLGRFYRSRPLWTLETLRNLPAAALRLRRVAKAFRPDAVIYVDPQLLLIGSVILPGLPNFLYHHDDAAGLRLFAGLGRNQCAVCIASSAYRILWRAAYATQASNRKGSPSCTTASPFPLDLSSSSPKSVDMPGHRGTGSAAQAAPVRSSGRWDCSECATPRLRFTSRSSATATVPMHRRSRN